MKISTFYLTDISEYDNFIKKLIEEIDVNFYGKGCTPIYRSKIITYLKKELTYYAKIKFNKEIIVCVNLPRIEKNLFERLVKNDKSYIYIRLNYDKIKKILEGNYYNYNDYLSEIIEQFNTYIQQEPTFEFDKYLVYQLNNLAEICSRELLIKNSPKYILEKIIDSKSWVFLSRQSSIFKDYFQLYLQDKQIYSNLFSKFLKTIGKILKDKNEI